MVRRSSSCNTLSAAALAVSVDGALLALSLWFLVHAGSYSSQSALFPRLVALPGVALCAVALAWDLVRQVRGRRSEGSGSVGSGSAGSRSEGSGSAGSGPAGSGSEGSGPDGSGPAGSRSAGSGPEVAVGHVRLLTAGIAGSAVYLGLVATLGFVPATVIGLAGGCALLGVRRRSLVIVLVAASAMSLAFLFVLAYGSGTPPPAGLLGL